MSPSVLQPFSGYVAPGFRAYWSSRGWYTMVSGLRDPRYPDHPVAMTMLSQSTASSSRPVFVSRD